MGKFKAIAATLIGIGLGVVIAFGLLRFNPFQQSNGENEAGVSVSSPVIGEAAPEFELASIDGESLRLSDYRGQVVLVNFWATWCGPCRLEMPDIQTKFDELDPDLKVIAVNFDESAEDVKDFVDELGLTFDVLLDPGASVQSLYRVRGYPSSYFVDREGILQIQHIGLMTAGQLEDYLDQLGLQ